MTSAKHASPQTAAKAALDFYIDHGVDVTIADDAPDKTALKPRPNIAVSTPNQQPAGSSILADATAAANSQPDILLGKSETRIEAAKLAAAATTLDELRDAIVAFDGIAIKKTATNLVFADGNAKGDIMLIGEAPGADEDRAGKPFQGDNGALLDKILASINLSRGEEDTERAVYLSNVLNWRPPGNRTPSPAEIEVSLPFIERHIQLIKPKLLIICGGVPAKSLLGRSESLSKLRKTWHDYTPQTPELSQTSKIPAIVTYHPEYLLRTPAQKRSTWYDMLSLQDKIQTL